MKNARWIFLTTLVMFGSACKFVPYFAPDSSLLYIYTDRTYLNTGGDQATITVMGYSSEGAPLRDHTRIMLQTDLGEIPPFVDLIDGKGEVTFKSDEQRGDAHITAKSGKVESGAIVIRIGPGDLTNLVIQANPPQLPPGGGRTEITVKAMDAGNTPLKGMNIQLSTSNGYFENGMSSQITDSNGMIQTFLNTKQSADITASSGTVSKTLKVLVESNNAPVADFYFSPMSPNQNETVNFNGSYSYDDDGVIVRYQWDFGDGDGTSGEEVTHKYVFSGTLPKTFKVVLKVFDEYGKMGIKDKDIIVKGTSTK